ncbi:hypothetical protein [Thauera sp. 2A1]|uniref:hypothetical protein n=1 Tax=Thauera sp. 2A1 TaxID=2570191 RepID=UPI0012921745|nr:hypothetical protein [Thauera sp. 2A1]KAI5912942.1 hypothetical protein GH664_20045 [Thauera sp. 2A1]
MATERTVRQLRVRAPDEALVRRARMLLEDALRTASLPGDGAAVVLVRRLSLPAFSSASTPQSLALALEAYCRSLQIVTVSEATTEDELAAAAAVRFRDPLHARQDLGLRLLRGTPPAAWCWALAVPGYHPRLGLGEALCVVAMSLVDLPEAEVAVPLWLDTIIAQGGIARLVASLDEDDAEALLAVLPAASRPSAAAGVRPSPGSANAAGDVRRVHASDAGATLSADWRRTMAWARHALAPADVRLRLIETCAHSRMLAARPGVAEPPLPADDVRGPSAETRRAAGEGHRRGGQGTASAAGRDGGLGSGHDDRGASRSPSDSRAAHGEATAPGAASTVRLQAGSLESAAAGPAGAHDVPADLPGRLHPVAGGTGMAPERTTAAGLLFLLPVLASLGLPEWLEENPAWRDAALPARILACTLRRLQVPEDDPAWLLGMAAADRREPMPAEDCWSALVAAGLQPKAQRTVEEIWLGGCRRWLRMRARIGVADLVLRPGHMAITATHADVWMAIEQTDLRVRRAGLDLDPGWLPWLGRVVHFHYGDTEP